MELRAFIESDGRAMQELQSRRWPLGIHPGGLGWLLAIGQVGEHLAVALDGDELIGWGAVDLPGSLTVQVAVGRSDAAAALLEWSEEWAEAPELSVVVNDEDKALREAAVDRGFQAGGPGGFGMWLDVEAGRPSADDYLLRPVGPEEYGERVESHRAAWRPASLPFLPGHELVVSEEATSSFDEAAYERCRSTWLYDPTLDLVAVAPDGAIAATCLAWLDPNTGVAELEPMGVHPDHRRRGLAGLLCHEVSRRVREMGGSEVFINSGPREDYPAPAAYAKAGFRTVRRGETFIRTLP